MRWRPEHLAFLRAWFPKLRIAELTERFNREYGLSLGQSQVRAAVKKHKIRCGRPPGFAKGERSMFTKEQDLFLREQYKALPLPALTDAFNQRFGASLRSQQIKTYIHNHGILSGRTGQFQPGLRPWNTGTKGLVPPNSGQFKPGQVPANHKEMGFERVNVYGYVEVKVAERNPYTGAPARYRLKHQVVWEAVHGPVPKGHVLRFLDGNKLNCALENLEAVSLAENLHLNRMGYADAPAEARETTMLLAKVEVRAFRGRKKAKEK